MVSLAARRGAQILYVFVTVGALLAALAVARLSVGPVSLNALAPIIQDRINADLGGWRLRTGELSLGWDARRHRLRLKFDDVGLKAPDGRDVAAAPQVSVRLHLGDALLGAISVTDIEVDGLTALVVRDAQGRIRFEMSGPEGAEQTNVDAVADAIETATAAAAHTGGQGGDALARLERLSLADLDLRYVDEAVGSDARLPNATLELRRTAAGLEALLSGELAFNKESPPMLLDVNVGRAADTDSLQISVNFERLIPASLAAVAPMFQELKTVDGALNGFIAGRVNLKDGRLVALSGGVEAEGARIALGGDQISFEELSAKMIYQTDQDLLEVTRLRALGDFGDMIFSVSAKLRRDQVGGIVGASGLIAVNSARLEPGPVYDEPLTLTSGDASFDIQASPGILVMDRFSIETPDVTVSGDLRASFGAASAVAAKLSATDFPVARLTALWPKPTAPGGRDWARDNLLGGMIRDLEASISVVDGVTKESAFRFSVDDLESRYLGDMPPIRGGDGVAKIEDGAFELALDAAEVETASGETLDLSGSSFRITDFDPEYPPGVVALKVAGPFAGLLSLLNEAPLRLVDKLDADLGEISGSIEAEAALAMPLKKDLPLSEIRVRTDGRVTDLSLMAPVVRKRVVFKTADLQASTEELRLSGRTKLDGLRVAVDWRERFSPARGVARTALKLAATLSAKRLLALGASPQFVIDGAVQARTEIRVPTTGAVGITLQGNLADLALAAPALGWSKPRGSAGELAASGKISGTRVRLSEINLNSHGLSIGASGAFGLDGALETLTIDPLVVGESTRLAVTISRGEAGGLRITGGGPRLRPALEGASLGGGAGGGAAATPVDFNLNVDEVLIGDNGVLSDVSVRGARDADGFLAGEALARTKSGAPVSLRVWRKGDTQDFLLSSEDAGSALASMGLVKDAAGGRMKLVGSMLAGVTRGELEVDDVTLLDAPSAAQALSVGSLIGVFDQMRSGGISFSRVRAPFEVTASAFEVRDAYARGPAIGVVLDGLVSRPDGVLDLDGTISPAFVINGLLSDVPLIGDLLTGGSGEGVLGVDFSMSGTLERPRYAANPLTVLTPGVFRRLFRSDGRLRDDDGALAPLADRQRGPEK